MTGPLAGIRVLELAGIGPAPMGCRILADLGAEVLRVERLRGQLEDGLADGRAVLRADLKDPADLARVLALVDAADVLVEGNRPGTTERLGIGPDECLARNPRLIYARMTGWGQDGPRANEAGHDLNYLSLTGALHAIGPAATPVVPLNLVADFGGGAMLLVTGVLAALLERTGSGQGQVLDVAMVDGATQLLGMQWDMLERDLWVDRREANILDGGAPYYAVYACKDGKHVAVGAIEPQFWAALVGVLGIADPGQHPRDWPAIREVLTQTFRTRTRDEWAAAFAGTDACVTPVLSMSEAPQDEHLAARENLVKSERGGLRPAPAPRFSRTPASVALAPDVEDLMARWTGTS